jgi:glycosyltransferase involved in cell wall biosynthesis
MRSNLAVLAPAIEGQILPELSLVVPAYNEEESLRALYARIAETLGERLRWELILVDDGSSDRTAERATALSKKDARVRAASLVRNSGQTTATRVGIEMARAPLIATLDADLQNDPADLPAMIDVLGENPDVHAVVGYRMVRRDTWLRRVSSRIANAVRNRLSGDDIRDTGCSLKVFRAAPLKRMPLFEGMHRFLPTLLRFHGYHVVEHPVSHRPRMAGESKYGVLNRAWVAFKDLLAVRWMRNRIVRTDVIMLSDDPPTK